MNAAIQRQVTTVTDCPACGALMQAGKVVRSERYCVLIKCYRCGAVLAMDPKEYEGGD